MNHSLIPVVEVETDFHRQRRASVAGRFLKGPISWPKIESAAQLSGSCLAVYILVQHMTDLTRETWVRLPPSLLKGLGISRDAKSRALRQLAEAGLVEIENTRGCATRVKIH